MIDAAKKLARPAAFRGRSGAMPADIVEGAEALVSSANHEQRLADELGSEIVAGVFNLVAMPNDLPGAPEDVLPFLRGDLAIEIERSGKSPGAGNIGIDESRIEQGHRVRDVSHCKAGRE